MAKNSGFIFDMDGVIVHSNPAHKRALQLFCKKHNQDVSDAFLEEKIYGRTNKEWIPELLGDVSPDKLKILADEKEQMFRDDFSPEDHVVAGIHHFLDKLRQQHMPMAVATSAPVENADYILSRLGIRNYFSAVLDSSHVTKGKPNPEVYLKAADALNHKPENCFVFEDSVSGVKAGLAAGAVVVGLATTHSKSELSHCHLVVDDFEKLEPQTLLSLALS